MAIGRTNGAMWQLVRVFQDGTLAGLSDGDALRRFVDDRDEAAFEMLLGRHGPMVLNVCRQILRDPDDAEDAFQATFLALACKASTLRVGSSLGPWLYRVANRVAARARADRRRRADRERSEGAIPEPASCEDPDRINLPLVVHEELDRLPERLRAPIVLCYLEGMTHERTAQQLGCPVGTVRSRMARGRALLHRRILKRGIVASSGALGAVLASNGCTPACAPHLPSSLVKVATQLVAGTASLGGGCGISARVAALLEGVLNVLRAKQLASAMAALAVIGVVVAVAGLSVFSASGQTDDPTGPRSEPERPRPVANDPEKPVPDTYVKTYYVGDLIGPVTPPVPVPGTGGKVAMRRMVDLSPVIDLITSTVAKGTWTVRDGRDNGTIIDGRPFETGGSSAAPRTVGHITPFFLSISLIVRHTAEVHDEVANLLRSVRRLQESWQAPEQTHDPKAAPSAHAALPDRNARIRELLDELRLEIEKLPNDRK